MRIEAAQATPRPFPGEAWRRAPRVTSTRIAHQISAKGTSDLAHPRSRAIRATRQDRLLLCAIRRDHPRSQGDGPCPRYLQVGVPAAERERHARARSHLAQRVEHARRPAVRRLAWEQHVGELLGVGVGAVVDPHAHCGHHRVPWRRCLRIRLEGDNQVHSGGAKRGQLLEPPAARRLQHVEAGGGGVLRGAHRHLGLLRQQRLGEGRVREQRAELGHHRDAAAEREEAREPRKEQR
mmetsp:Transcript_29637/g.69187  ORF Transcript_29637/g.69187 Transcript_29637/m.69187 type:complete len:237 (+) Transcript_29637:389-1099(+)